jgi:ElaB/YqjD/DUF883 family membrane-anchored ribosome-binding protein
MANEMTTQDPGAAERAGEVAGVARDEARDVAGEVRDEAKALASEAATQVHNVVDSTRSALRTQAHQNTERASGALGDLGSQFRALAQGDREGAGALGRYADEAGARLRSLADQLNRKGFDGVVDDVQTFARRRPGAFLAIAAASGFVAGRLFRGAQASSSSETPAPAAPEAGNGQGQDMRALEGTDQTPPASPVPPLTTGAARHETAADSPLAEPAGPR